MDAPVCILLCAGKGTRMGEGQTHKVCYPIAGRPAILRLMDHLREAGVSRFVVVVGSKAEQVMACLAGQKGVVFAYQKEQKGTGDAALAGLRAMADMGMRGPVMIAMGDKIIAPEAARSLFLAYTPEAGAAFAVQPAAFNVGGGRVVMADGEVFGIVEKMDVCLKRLGEAGVSGREALKAAIEQLDLSPGKKEKLLETALASQTMTEPMRLKGRLFAADELEASGLVNAACYVMDGEAATNALLRVGSDNAQGELYLTDAINLLAEKRPVRAVCIQRAEDLLTFSTLEDLMLIEQHFAPQNASPPKLQTAGEMLLALSRDDWRAAFEPIYGSDEALLLQRREAVKTLLEAFISTYGDKPAVLVRAPGRVNLMGRHIEHRGGSINVMAVQREMLALAAARADDTVNIHNVREAFAPRSFRIMEHVRRYDTTNWVDFIESDAISSLVTDSRGDWLNYVRAGVLRLQLEDKSRILPGMDMMFYGDIPIAAGLSSSSSIVVATMEAAVALGGMEVKVQKFIHLCGEGEWFVGSRGGAGDHAAMKCGQKDGVTHIGFAPFAIGASAPFPRDYALIVANSFVEAKKSAGAKDQFNARVASYVFGLLLLQAQFPAYRERMRCLKDVNPKTLQVPPSRIYEMLLTLPARITPEALYEALPAEAHDTIRQTLKTHASQPYYEIRSVVMYGICECERAELCPKLMAAGEYEALGKLMNISHDGDRVYKNGEPYEYGASDVYLYRLIQDLKSEVPERVLAAQLYNQPGGYACSTKTIDALVDYTLGLDGVVGAQLSGAGLGGCVMMLVRANCADNVLAALDDFYYKPADLPMGAEVFQPVAGSGSLSLDV